MEEPDLRSLKNRLAAITRLCLEAASNRSINKVDRALYRVIARIADGSVALQESEANGSPELSENEALGCSLK
jgi:hypothetical protein